MIMIIIIVVISNSWRCSWSFSRKKQNVYFSYGLKEVQTFANFWPYLKTYFLQVTQFISSSVSVRKKVILGFSLLSFLLVQ